MGNNNVPLVAQLNWVGLLLTVSVWVFLFFTLSFFDIGEPVLISTILYCLLAYLVRNIWAKSHRKGIKLVKQDKLKEAIPFFEDSVQFFTQNTWIDKFRAITLLSPSKMTYREMGMNNVAFCYSQIGEGEKAKELYEKLLVEYPDNGIAKAALNLINSLRK